MRLPKIPKKLRVLHLLPGLQTGGLERMVLELCRELKNGPWDIEPQVLAYDHPKSASDPGLLPQFQSAAIPVTLLSKSRGFSPTLVIELATRTRSAQIPLIHSHDLGALIYGSIARTVRPGGLSLLHTQHSLLNLQNSRCQRLFSRLTDGVVAVSEPVATAYAKLLGEKKRPLVIENGVRFARPPSITLESRQERRAALIESLPEGELRSALGSTLQADSGERWALCLARVCESKGQVEAVDIWSRLPQNAIARSKLLFVGPSDDQRYLNRLHSRINGLPDAIRRTILVCGPTTEPESWMHASDAFVSASRFEGVPLAALEAAGAGNALLLSEISGHRNFLPEATSFALSQPGEAAIRLTELLEQQGEAKETLRLERIAGQVRARYFSRIMAERYAAAYRAILLGNRLDSTLSAPRISQQHQ